MGLENIDKTFKEYNEIAAKQEKDPDNGPYEAYGGGKSHDVWGKKFFHNLPVEASDAYHVAIVTPVIHYCMGGIKISPDAEVLNAKDEVIGGLYAGGSSWWSSWPEQIGRQFFARLCCVRSRLRAHCCQVCHSCQHQIHRRPKIWSWCSFKIVSVLLHGC